MARTSHQVVTVGAVAIALVALPVPMALADPGAVDPEAVRTFFDQRLPALLEDQNVPGAAVSVVDADGEIFTGEYGLADLGEQRPVDAATTAFPTASVAKSFTAIAVLQLVDAGELDLHTDVNDYLPAAARLPDTHPDQPVTLHHLMTHTAGFAEIGAGFLAPTAEEIAPLPDHVVENQPARVRPPGRFVGYSNFGVDLAGYIVEVTSGRPFEDYMAEEVFAPLGMDRTAFAPPPPAPERPDVPTTYEVVDGENVPVPPEFANGAPSPSGDAHAPVTDLGRFLRALLNDGELDGTRVLSADGVAAMLDRQADTHPALPGTGYGMWEGTGEEPRWLWHSGDGPGTHTKLVIVPERELAVYVAVNGDGVAPDLFSTVRDVIVDEFLTEFAGVTTTPPPDTSGEELDAYTGSYVSTRMTEGEPFTLLRTLVDSVTVTAPGDGTLRTSSPIIGEDVWHPYGDGAFVDADGEERLGFVETEGGVVGLAYGLNPTQAYEREHWYTTTTVLLPVAAVALLVLLSTAVWPAATLLRAVRRRTARASERGAASARALAGSLTLLCLGGLGFLAYLMTDFYLLETTPLTVQLLPLTLAAPVAVGVVACAVFAWRRGWWGRGGRLHYTAVALAALVFLAVAGRYGLMWLP